MFKLKTPKLKKILKACQQAFLFVAFFSFLINLLMLTVPLYMLQIFDRVIAGHSYDTLIFLTIIAIIAVAVLGLLDIARARVLVRVSRWLDNQLSPLVLSRSCDEVLSGGTYASESLRDIATIRNFLSGPSIFSLFDAPWTPVYLLVIFLLQPILGTLATIGAIILFIFALFNEIVTRENLRQANANHIKNQQQIDKALNNAEVIQAMGMLPNIVNKWFKENEKVLDFQSKASDSAGIILSVSKFFRLALQLGILGIGAYYVIRGEITAGVMIAASIITARALAPIEQSIGTWKQAKSARYSYARLLQYLESKKPRAENISLPKPKGEIQLENVVYIPPGSNKPIIYNVSFKIQPGQTVVLLGPSGAGKSTLARLMLGIWKPTHGNVRLDGADVYDWDRTDFGKEVGYLPQDVDLFHGSIHENIARMGKGSDDEVIKAAKVAGAHKMILRMPEGYGHHAGGFNLSGGQRQRIGLARAFYGDPRVIILDEPNASLDSEGEAALDNALHTARERGVTMVLISHRTNLVKHADLIAVLSNGQLQVFGPRDKVLQKLQENYERIKKGPEHGK